MSKRWAGELTREEYLAIKDGDRPRYRAVEPADMFCMDCTGPIMENLCACRAASVGIARAEWHGTLKAIATRVFDEVELQPDRVAVCADDHGKVAVVEIRS